MKETKTADHTLPAVIVLDSFEKRLYPLLQNDVPWAFQTLCNVPIIDYTLSWLLRTEVRKVVFLVVERNAVFTADLEKTWGRFFEIHIVVCKNAMTTGDCVRELDGRSVVNGDFLLITNPAVLSSATLEKEISNYRRRRKESKDNVMTLIYSYAVGDNESVVGIEDGGQQLRLYHRADDSTKLDIDDHQFIEDVILRRDIVDTGIAICSMNIAAQFCDNFDFKGKDDVVREILVNEELLLQKIHLDVLSEDEPSFVINDYPSFLLGSTLLQERWFYPLTPSSVFAQTPVFCFKSEGNVYINKDSATIQNLVPFTGFNVSVGANCVIHETAKLSNVVLGKNVVVGKSCQISNCIIGDDCVIGDNCTIKQSVVGKKVSIGANLQIPAQTVIAGKITVEESMELVPNKVYASVEPLEDYDELFTVEKNELFTVESVGKNVFAWELTDGGTFWFCKASGSKDDQNQDENFNNSDDEEGSDGEMRGNGEFDTVSQFLSEVQESMQRIHELASEATTGGAATQFMNNLILEINSSKLAYNISMEDVAKYVFYSFTALPGTETIAGVTTLIKQWKKLFDNYYKPHKSQIQLLFAIEDRYKENFNGFKTRTPKLVHTLYNDLDVLEEEAILEWADSLPEDSELAKDMKRIVDWLREDSDDEDSD